MKVFISWSGDGSKSHEAAKLLRTWLPQVIQVIDPFVSSEDTAKGAQWPAELRAKLEEADFGIACLSRENMGQPWLNFEAGALAHRFDKNLIAPVLIDLASEDVRGPLSNYQHTRPNKGEMLLLVKTLSSLRGEGRLGEKRLEEAFKVWWPKFETRFDEIANMNAAGEGEPERGVEDMMAEVLKVVRNNSRELADIRDTGQAGSDKQQGRSAELHSQGSDSTKLVLF